MATRRAEISPANAGALVLDGQRSLTPVERGWCERSSDRLRIVTSDGFFRPACKRRDCPRCWARRSRETARCLVLDARVEMPTHCLTLTTATPWEELDPATYREGSRMVFQRLRRRLGRVEYFGAIEHTTGKSKRSRGGRHTHGHYLLKHDREELDVVWAEKLVRETWEHVTGAWRVEVAKLVTPGAALGYLGLHHRKPEQAPPAAWRGMTERSSQGYWSRPIAELRQQAKHELAVEAIAHRQGLTRELAELELAARPPARVIEVRRAEGAAAVEPIGTLDDGDGRYRPQREDPWE